MKELFDTCILIEYLNGKDGAKADIDKAEDPAISRITWIEVMVGTKPETEEVTRRFLDRFAILPLDGAVSEQAITIRKGQWEGLGKKPKLPDAIILATALCHGLTLVTLNKKDFPDGTDGVRLASY